MNLIDFILHVDKHLADFVAQYGLWIYGLLFLIVFIETGLVVMPLLPGDSLLFAAGMLAAVGQLNPWLLTGLLITAAVLGDNCNYWIGRRIGRRAFSNQSRLLNINHLHKAEAFFVRHGGKALVIGRFMPIVRTFTPFVAGVGTMPYRHFLLCSVLGGALWVTTFVWMGYLLGNIPFVKQHFTLIGLIIVVLSILPALISLLKPKNV